MVAAIGYFGKDNCMICCSVLHCATVRCSVLRRVAACCRVLQDFAAFYSVVRCVAACCSFTS